MECAFHITVASVACTFLKLTLKGFIGRTAKKNKKKKIQAQIQTDFDKWAVYFFIYLFKSIFLFLRKYKTKPDLQPRWSKQIIDFLSQWLY